jgi:hypothetical protein
MAIARVNVLDFLAFGKVVVQWSLDPSTRPRTLRKLKEELRDILEIPDRITRIKYVDVDQETLVIRVPNKEMVEESIERFSGRGQRAYPAPAFYRDLMPGPNRKRNIDILHCRIADYTIAQCA